MLHYKLFGGLTDSCVNGFQGTRNIVKITLSARLCLCAVLCEATYLKHMIWNQKVWFLFTEKKLKLMSETRTFFTLFYTCDIQDRIALAYMRTFPQISNVVSE